MSSLSLLPPASTFAACRAGFTATWTSVFSSVLFGTYLGIGARSKSRPQAPTPAGLRRSSRARPVSRSATGWAAAT
jgi:hypothetical protein